MFLRWYSFRFLQIMTPEATNGPASELKFFAGKSLKIFFSETTGPISTIFHRNVPWVVFFQIPKKYDPRA